LVESGKWRQESLLATRLRSHELRRARRRREMIRRAIGIGLMLALAPLSGIAGHLERQQASELNKFQFIQVDKKSGEQKGNWMEGKVPGDLITDLVKAGKLKHPYYDFNAKKALWVNEYNWLYQTEFSAEAGKDERVWILFHGIDYKSRGSLNGKEIFDHTGMFSRVFVDATALLKKGEANELDVQLEGLGNLINSGSYTLDEILEQWNRRHTTKTQMSYGWDFAPELIGAGIWDRVEMFKTGPALIEELGIRTKNSGEVWLDLAVDSNQAGKATLKVTVLPENFGDKKSAVVKEFPLELSAGKSRNNLKFQISDPKFWWSWDLGEPNLYRVQAELMVNKQASDKVEDTFGFREIEWEQNPGAPEGFTWVLRLNGKRIFLRGANWVPPESMYGQLTDERYAALLKLARDAHINIFRIWGGGNRERDIFYDLADRNGIFLWQEFPLACIFIPTFPTDEEFLSLVEQESGEIIRAIRNHPSVILYSGGNEFDTKKNAPVVSRMRKAVQETDPDRRFIAASPAEGDSHNWSVWHRFGNLLDYYSDEHALMSEFGLQSYPALSTLKKYISADLLWPIGKVYVFHDLGPKKMLKYLSALPHPDTLEGTVEASQKMQAYYYQRATEHWRIRKYRYSGTLFWQFNEPWPAICWSVIDYELTPKLAYERIQDSYNPLLIAADLAVRGWNPGDDFSTDIFLVNDYDRKFSGLKIQAYASGKLAGTWVADADPDSSAKIAALNANLAPDAPASLELFVWDGDQLVSQNYYDLEVYDPKPSDALMRTVDKVVNQVGFGEQKPEKED